MRLREIITERGEKRILPDGTYEYLTHAELMKDLNSDYAPFIAGAEEFIKKNPPRNELWPEKWNDDALAVIKSRQDQYASQMTMPKAKQKLPSLIPNRAGLTIGDLGRPVDGISAIAGGGTPPEDKVKPSNMPDRGGIYKDLTGTVHKLRP